MSSHDAALAELRQSLVTSGGNYLRNTLHISGVTCEMCARPVAGYQRCYKCAGYAADLVGAMIYGVDGQQSGRLMYGYKSTTPGPSHRQIVKSLAALGIRGHLACMDKLAGLEASRWATVPSLRQIGKPHPFRDILTSIFSTDEEIAVSASALAASKSAQERRDVNPALYSLDAAVPSGAHVMLVDDTWTSGGHAQSVAVALKQAGAGRVSILTMARWLDMSDELTKKFYRDQIKDRLYDPMLCPWTGGTCP